MLMGFDKAELRMKVSHLSYLHMICRFLLKANLNDNVTVHTGANGEPGQSAVW